MSISYRYMVIVESLRLVYSPLRRCNTYPCLYIQIPYRFFSGHKQSKAKLQLSSCPDLYKCQSSGAQLNAVAPYSLSVCGGKEDWLIQLGHIPNGAIYALQSPYILQTKQNFTSCCRSPVSSASLKKIQCTLRSQLCVLV